MAEEEERRDSLERVVSGIRSHSSGAGEPSSSAASSSLALAGDQTSAREDARNNGKRKGSSRTAHTCKKCGGTFVTGQSLGGHMRKHYAGPPIIANKKRAREQREETPAPTVEHKVRMASHFNGPLESHNPALLSQLQKEPEWSSAGNGARRLHNFIALLDKGPQNAPQPESERKDDDGDDDELLSLRLGQSDFPRSSSGV